jgi:AmiR/NasT family two-component response regulator
MAYCHFSGNGAHPMSKIMIVDNDITVQMDLEEYFGQSHHHLVGIVETEEEAIFVARETRPDIILVEIELPGEIDGIGIAGNIKRDMDVGILFMTVCSNIDVVNRAKQVSPLAYVLKPFDVRGISAAIEIALHNQTKARKLQAANRKLKGQVAEQGIELASLKDESEDYSLIANVHAPVLRGARVSAIGLTKWRFTP